MYLFNYDASKHVIEPKLKNIFEDCEHEFKPKHICRLKVGMKISQN